MSTDLGLAELSRQHPCDSLALLTTPKLHSLIRGKITASLSPSSVLALSQAPKFAILLYEGRKCWSWWVCARARFSYGSGNGHEIVLSNGRAVFWQIVPARDCPSNVILPLFALPPLRSDMKWSDCWGGKGENCQWMSQLTGDKWWLCVYISGDVAWWSEWGALQARQVMVFGWAHDWGG